MYDIAAEVYCFSDSSVGPWKAERSSLNSTVMPSYWMRLETLVFRQGRTCEKIKRFQVSRCEFI